MILTWSWVIISNDGYGDEEEGCRHLLVGGELDETHVVVKCSVGNYVQASIYYSYEEDSGEVAVLK